MVRKLMLLPLFCEALLALLWARPRIMCLTDNMGFALCTSPTPDRIAWAINRATPFVPHATCLICAIAAHDLLARHGYAAKIHIGVAKSAESGFKAHAWVEYNGDVLVGRTAIEYTTLLSWSPAQ